MLYMANREAAIILQQHVCPLTNTRLPVDASQDALSCTPHTRTQDQLACISKLLSSFPLYSRLLPDALEAAARQVQSLCLSAGAELPRSVQEEQQSCKASID
jgi:hypothetical protein